MKVEICDICGKPDDIGMVIEMKGLLTIIGGWGNRIELCSECAHILVPAPHEMARIVREKSTHKKKKMTTEEIVDIARGKTTKLDDFEIM